MEKRQKLIISAAGLFLILSGTVLFAQDGSQGESISSSNNSANEETAEQDVEGENAEEVSFAELATILEEINHKMGVLTGERRRKDDGPAPDEGFGGGSYWPVRIYFGMDTMNSYVQSLGTYEPFPMISVPFADGGGGTWRISFNKYFQIGANFWGGGFSSLGQQYHQDPVTSPTLANITVDEDGDGLDDYYSYASYSYFYWSFLAMGKLPLHRRINLVFGGQIGIGEELFGISRNQRKSSLLGGALGVMHGDSDWSRMLFIPGAWTGIQLNVDKKNIFKLGLDVGFDYPVPMQSWMPESGVHTEESAPPESFNSMNLNIGLNMQFHF